MNLSSPTGRLSLNLLSPRFIFKESELGALVLQRGGGVKGGEERGMGAAAKQK